MTLTELKERKRELGLTNEDIARMSFVPLSTVQKVFGGTVSSPRRDTLEKLSLALQKNGYIDNKVQGIQYLDRVHETEYAYNAHKKKDSYTIEDYDEINKTRRVELIDGEIYDMAAPSTIHQAISMNIVTQLMMNKEKCAKDCSIFFAPLDVKIDLDNRTCLQPDILIICDPKKRHRDRIYGPPEFVLEIVSPGNRWYDMQKKLTKYSEAGCKEYWIVDHERNKVIKYDFTQDSLIEVYTLDDKVPLAISDNKCSVDFAEVRKVIESFTD